MSLVNRKEITISFTNKNITKFRIDPDTEMVIKEPTLTITAQDGTIHIYFLHSVFKITIQ